jgi:ketosteroid isomerase-like protein
MHPNQATIERFYAAFAQLDTEGMARCYAEDATFDDEAFSLKGKREVVGMWRMLCDATRAKNRDAWRLAYRDAQADASTGTAHWDAWYRFGATGRMVHNSIAAEFQFGPQGLIKVHQDSFDFWRWSRQALGTPGLLLGWTPLLRGKVRRQAGCNLRKFLEREGT